MKYYNLQQEKVTVLAQYHYTYVPCLPGTTVQLDETEDGKKVGIKSKIPLKRVRLAWNTPLAFEKTDYIMGDVFERGYFSFRWKKESRGQYYWYVAVSDKTNTVVYGVKTGCSVFASWQIRQNRIVLTLDCRNGSYPVCLGERELNACEIISVRSLEGEKVVDTLRRACKIMCPHPRLPKSPVYGSNSWYYIFSKTTDKLMRMDADLLYETTKDLKNRPYCVLDDGWESVFLHAYNRSHEKTWVVDKEKFPDMKGLVEYIHRYNMKAGIWIRPLIGSLATDKKERLNHGKVTAIALDPTLPSVLEEVRKNIRRIKEWGFDLIKHDYSTFDIFGKFQHTRTNPCMPFRKFSDRTKTTAEIVLNFYKVIREEAGDDVILIGCNTISHLSAGLFELQRIGDDTSPSAWWKVRNMGVNSLAFRQCQHNNFYACDADCVGYTGEIPWEKDVEWLKLLSYSGTPLFTSIDPRKVTPEIKEDLKKAYRLASKQEIVAEPQTWFDDDVPKVWKTDKETFTFKL